MNLKMKRINLVLLLFAASFLTACGASKSSNTNGASRIAPESSFDEYSGGGSGVYSNCNSIPSNTYGFNGPISSYYDTQAGAYIDDLIRIKFNDEPAELTTTQTHYVEIYRFKGNHIYNQNPVEIYFQLKGTGEWIQEPVTTLSRATIQQVIIDNNLGDRGYTTDNFFDGVIMTLSGMSLEWDAISIYLYDESTGTAPIGSVDALLPAFDANPNSYAVSHPEQTLQNLHPMWIYRNSGFSDLDYYNATFNLCSGF